jgi:hypothetical protein
MRKFYSIVNVIAFLMVIYYVTNDNASAQVKHGTLVIGIISLFVSGYMTFYEYTDDTDQKHQEHINTIKSTYKGRLDDYNQKSQTLVDIQNENKSLVNDVVQTKNIVSKLTDIIERLEQPDQHDTPPMFTDPIPQSQSQLHSPDTGDTDYHMSSPNNRPIANIDQNSGPPDAMLNTQDDFDIDARLKEYDSLEIGKPPGPPPMPDFLKPANTSKRDDSMSAY